jgi:hypothetical protein
MVVNDKFTTIFFLGHDLLKKIAMTNKARPLSYYLKYLNTNNRQTEWTLFAILWVKKYFSKADTQIFLASIISKIASFKVSIIQVQVRAWTKSSYRLLEHCRKAARSSKWWFWRGVQFKKLIIQVFKLDSPPSLLYCNGPLWRDVAVFKCNLILSKNLLTILFLAFIPFLLRAQNTVGLISIESELTENGYNLIYPERQSTVFLLNNCGEIVHSWSDDPASRPGKVAYLLDDGNLLRAKINPSFFSSPSFGAGGAGGIVELVSWENDVLWTFVLADSLNRLHHDVHFLNNGNILMLAWEKKNLQEIVENGFDTLTNPQREIWTDYILEVDPITDSTVWEWHAWDHLIQDYDSTKANYGNVSEHPELIDINYHEYSLGRQDWMHSNALDYHFEKDQVLLSVRNFNEFWIIDHSTNTDEATSNSGGNSGKGGNLLYRWGNPKAYKSGETEDRKLFYQHDAQWIDDFVNPDYEHYGKVVLFNNVIDNGISYGQILAPEWNAGEQSYAQNDGLFLPEDFTKTISHPDVSKNHSTAASSIQVIGNGHVIMCAARQGFSFELTSTDELVWEYRVPIRNGFPVEQGTELALSDNFTFQLDRYPMEYSAFTDKDLSPKGYIELLPDTTFCDLFLPVKEPLPVGKFNIYPNPTTGDLYIHIEKASHTDLNFHDVLGRVVKRVQLIGGDNYIDVSNLNRGVYYLKIEHLGTKILVISN